MELIDTHCHLDEDAFAEDRAAVVARATQAGLSAIITIGTTVQSSRRAVDLANEFACVYAAVGIQPNYVAEAKPGDWEIIEEIVTHPKVVAVGETGLDRYWDYAPFDLQVEYFAKHIALACKHRLPFVVHCRDAGEDVVAQLREAAPSGEMTGVMHSFCGNAETARACLELGLYISFAGMLTYKKSGELREVAGQIPCDRVLVETDAPYLAPTPKRGKRNEPAFVQHTAACLAEIYGNTAEEMAIITTGNARKLFGLEDRK